MISNIYVLFLTKAKVVNLNFLVKIDNFLNLEKYGYYHGFWEKEIIKN